MQRVLRTYGQSHVGHVRMTNEDGFAIAGHRPPRVVPHATPAEFDLGESPVLLAVADGMGGPDAGVVASAEALSSIEESFMAWDGDDARAFLLSAFEAANRAVRAVTCVPERRGTGTTLTAAIVDGASVHAGHAGDSRLYVLRRRKLYKATLDHNIAQFLVLAGRMTWEEAAQYRGAFVPFNHLGQRPDVHIQLLRIRLARGDRLLLCTDGVLPNQDEQHLRSILLAWPDAERACEQVVAAALDPGPDNITAIVADSLGNAFPNASEDDAPDDIVEFLGPPAPESFLSGLAGRYLISVVDDQ